jgi:hypothetical protein
MPLIYSLVKFVHSHPLSIPLLKLYNLTLLVDYEEGGSRSGSWRRTGSSSLIPDEYCDFDEYYILLIF